MKPWMPPGSAMAGDLQVRHACEVLVNDVGHRQDQPAGDGAADRAEGRRLCRLPDRAAVRGPDGRGQLRCLRPAALSRRLHRGLRRRAGALGIKTTCCGGSVSICSPDKTLHLIQRHFADGSRRRRRLDRHSMSAVPDKCRNVSSGDQPEIWNRISRFRSCSTAS